MDKWIWKDQPYFDMVDEGLVLLDNTIFALNEKNNSEQNKTKKAWLEKTLKLLEKKRQILVYVLEEEEIEEINSVARQCLGKDPLIDIDVLRNSSIFLGKWEISQ